MNNKKTINRRNFLKSLGAFLAGIIILPFSRAVVDEHAGQIKPKEAKFYTSGEKMAG